MTLQILFKRVMSSILRMFNKLNWLDVFLSWTLMSRLQAHYWVISQYQAWKWLGRMGSSSSPLLWARPQSPDSGRLAVWGLEQTLQLACDTVKIVEMIVTNRGWWGWIGFRESSPPTVSRSDLRSHVYIPRLKETFTPRQTSILNGGIRSQKRFLVQRLHYSDRTCYHARQRYSLLSREISTIISS